MLTIAVFIYLLSVFHFVNYSVNITESQGGPSQLANYKSWTPYSPVSPITSGIGLEIRPSDPMHTAKADVHEYFQAGTAKPPGSNYSRVMIIPRMKEDDIGWITKELPDTNMVVYVADDPGAPLHPPKNKGHEVMIYLSYIIDHYDQLPDILIFMHAHRWTHHNNELLGFDAAQMIQRLSYGRVTREGYMNMNCHWDPGCPEWLHPTSSEESLKKQEEPLLAKCWSELFPFHPLPNFLAQPCCAQFALSRARVRAIPLSRFIFYRDWIMRTPLSDYISGRIWEYSWQFVFTGRTAVCPAEHACYCDGFGVCFGGESQYKEFLELRDREQEYISELAKWQAKEKFMDEASQISRFVGVPVWQQTEPGRHLYLRDQIRALNNEIEARRQNAMQRGDDPRYRAEEAGRQWKEGDGF